jgi:hypothetical protein
MADAMKDLTESASTTGASMPSIAKTFEAREQSGALHEQSRMVSEILSIRRARLDEIKWLYENEVITREDFLSRIKAFTDQSANE